MSDDRWDAFASRHCVVYHHSGRLRALEREYAHESIALLGEDATGVCGILPLMRTRGLPSVLKPGGQVVDPRLSSLPRTPVAGPLFTSRDAGAALLGAAMERVRAERRLRLQLKREGTLNGVTDGVVAIIPGKTYEYIASGRPILAAVPDGDARALLEESGTAPICRPNDVGTMARIIAEQIARARRRDPMPPPPPELVDRFEYRRLSGALASVFDGVLGRRVRRSVAASAV